MTRQAPGIAPARAVGTLAVMALACALALPAALEAQDDRRVAVAAGTERADATAGPGISLTVQGVNYRAQPGATVTLDRAAHVGVFEVEPGVGATLLWPHGGMDDPVAAGSHSFRLNGPRMATYRSLMLSHLGTDFLFRSPNQQDVHLVAVVSEAPLRTDRLLSGRVFGIDQPRAGPARVVEALLSRVLSNPLDAAWSYDRLSFPRFWDGDLASSNVLLGPPFLAVHVPLDPGLDLARRSACDTGLLLSLTALTTFPGFSTFRSGSGICPTVARAGEEPSGNGLSKEITRRLRRVADARTSATSSSSGPDIEGLARELADVGIDVPSRRIREIRTRGRQQRRSARALRARLNRVQRARRMQAARTGSPVGGDVGIPAGKRLDDLTLPELRRAAERAGIGLPAASALRGGGAPARPAAGSGSDGSRVDRESIRRAVHEAPDRGGPPTRKARVESAEKGGTGEDSGG